MDRQNIKSIRNIVVSLIPQTILFMYVYYLVSLSVPFLSDHFWQVTFCYLIGEVFAVIFILRSLRSWVFVVVALVLYFIISPAIAYVFGGEFDTFIISLKFRLMFFMLLSGFLFTYFILRYRWGNVLFLLFTVSVALNFIMDIPEVLTSTYLILFGILILLILAVFLFTDLNNSPVMKGKLRWRYISATLLTLFLFVFIYIFIGRESEIKIDQIQDLEHGYTDTSLIEKKNGRISIKSEMGLDKSNNNGKQLVFLAYIENYFEDQTTPNPLYLTAYHYSKYDTASQDFLPDSLAPDLAAFHPDLENLPLAETLIDSDQYRAMAKRPYMHPVKMTVFNKALAPSEFLAPYSAYSVVKNPLTIDQSKEYTSSFVTYSLVSDWNSAYFIYNTYNAPDALLNFQQQRYDELQKYNDYSEESPVFMKYYTSMPQGEDYKDIQDLADNLVSKSNAKTTLDKVLAVKDYFLSRDLAGNYVYTYTDNPGEPGIPDRSRLYDFLFETHKGYCAYFAGSGYFLLRAMGVPSRIAVGFMTVDRSDKNKGWYWYYQNQAHAWIQVYFPELGWLDFDYTIGNDEARIANQADGTPPIIPQNPDLSTRARILNIDPVKKSMEVQTMNITYKGNMSKEGNEQLKCDMSDAQIILDSVLINLDQLRPLDTVVLLTEKLDIETKDIEKVLEKLREDSLHVDQAFLIQYVPEESMDEMSSKQENEKFGSKVLKFFGLLLLLILLIPLFYMIYLFLMNGLSRKAKTQAYYNNLAMLYFTHQLGMKIGDRTNLQYAKDIVDPELGTNYTIFMNKYLRLKYDDKYEPDLIESTYFRGYFAQELFGKILPELKFKQYLQIFNPIEAINFIIKYYFI